MRNAFPLLVAASLPLAVLAATLAATPTAVAAPAKKPAPTPTPAPPPPPPPPPPAPKLTVEFGACPREPLSELDGAGLAAMMRKRCRNLKVPEGSAPTDIADDDMIVVLCTKEVAGGHEAIEVKQCGLKAQVAGEGVVVPVGPDGEFALALRADRIDRTAHPIHGAPLTLHVTWSGKGLEGSEARAPLAFRRGFEGYGGGRWVWIPAPMLTTDLTWASPRGYRLGLTPLAVAAGGKFAVGARGYVGTSVFVAWNLLVPNDVTTLSNGTGVRLNYRAFGGGLLLDAAGWVSVGVGVGHTFTSDARTDLRFWLYLGPKLLAAVQ